MHKPTIFFLTSFWWLSSVGQAPDIQNLYEEGFSYYRKGEKLKAIEVFEKIYAWDSTETDALDYKTTLYHQTGQYEKASTGFVKLCKLFPDKEDIISSAAFNFCLIKKPEIAERYARRAVELNGAKYNNMLNLAHACLLQSKNQQAIYWYAKAIEWVPSLKQFEGSFLGDFQLFDSLKLFPLELRKNLGVPLLEKYKTFEFNQQSTRLFDSIMGYQNKKLTFQDEEKLKEWKIAFLVAEQDAKIPRVDVMATFYMDLGLQEYKYRNRTVAMNYFDKAGDIYLGIGDSLKYTSRSIFLSKELMVYQQVENESVEHPLVLEYALDGLWNAEKYNITELKSSALIQVSNAYQSENNELENFKYLHKLLQWANQIHDYAGYFQATNGLSVFHLNNKQYDSSLYYHTLALQKIDYAWLWPFQRIQMQLNGLDILKAQGKYEEAIQKAEELKKQLVRDRNTGFSKVCNFIGSCYTLLNLTNLAYTNYKEAVLSYIKTSNEIEKKGKDLLPVMVNEELEDALWSLCEIAVSRNDANDLFYWSEMVKDNMLRYLITFQHQPDYISTLASAKAALPADAVAISYTGTHLRESASCMGFDNKKHHIENIQKNDIIKKVNGKILDKTLAKLREMYADSFTDKDSILLIQSLPLAHFLYISNTNPVGMRGIAVKRNDSNVEKELSEEKITLSKLLYTIYVAPFEKMLVGKKKIMVSADFLLHFIPFETLILPDGRYLGEVYDITYVPGFTNYQLLTQRDYYEGENIIAIGNPDYSTYHPELLLGRALDFAQVGITSWNDLPGTERELNTLEKINNSVTLLTGKKLSETQLKKMSNDSLLLNAAVLHFALHGISGAASAAEDNSLVVTEPDGGNEDGLLQFYEAYELNIRPKLVCLSACQTGLGMLEKDGSLITMATAFLAAGAKAVLATNWSIDDAATALFIKEVYSQVREQKISFSAAVANTKRKFIKGDFGEKYKQPLYWAPFKYYGN